MKAFILLFPFLAFSATQTVIDPSPAKEKLHEILSVVKKNEVACLEEGKTTEACKKKMQDELYANGIPRDWFEKGEKEYQEFWASKKTKE